MVKVGFKPGLTTSRCLDKNFKIILYTKGSHFKYTILVSVNRAEESDSDNPNDKARNVRGGR